MIWAIARNFFDYRCIQHFLATSLNDRKISRLNGAHTHIDRHYRRPQPHTGHYGLEETLEPARVKPGIRRGSTHIKLDDALDLVHLRGARHADNAVGRPRQDRILASNDDASGRPAIRYSRAPFSAAAISAT